MIYTDKLCVVAAPGGHSIAAEDKLQAATGKPVGALIGARALSTATGPPGRSVP